MAQRRQVPTNAVLARGCWPWARALAWLLAGLLQLAGGEAVARPADKSAAKIKKGKAAPAKNAKAGKGARADKAEKGHHADKSGVGKAAAKAARANRHGKTGDDAEPKPLTAKEMKKVERERAELKEACQGKKAARTAKCKKFARDEKDRQAEADAAALDKKCSDKKNKKLKECKALASKGSKAEADPCGRKYGRPRKKESLAKFAKRYGVAEAAVRKLNDLGEGKVKLRAGKRYLVAKSPHDGVVLVGGVQMPLNGETFRLRRPQNAWGKPLLVEALQRASAAVQAQSPLLATVMIGDLSKDGGGCLPPHKSHRGGLDVDVGYYLRGAVEPKVLADARPDTLDADRTWQFLKAILVTGRVQYAFVHYSLQPALYQAALRAGESQESLYKLLQYPRPQERSQETPIRHLDGHDDHSHIRLSCGDEACELSEEARQKMAATRIETLGGPGDETRGSHRFDR
ncbi:MAG: penicillin-insensitive murein endopeptidase, partial [Deltaproteobacteria bacterium]|nr:penicillin-insensitive murein endopeptidase [Deltaproteobacteria bacterium]